MRAEAEAKEAQMNEQIYSTENAGGSVRRRGLRALLLGMAAGGILFGAVGPASAVTGYSANGAGLAVRSAPNTAASVITRLGNGQQLDIVCQTTMGSNVSGSTVWDKLNGFGGGYVTDYYVNGTPFARPDPRIPNCNTLTQPPTQPPTQGRAHGRTSSWNNATAGQCTWLAKDRFHAATGVYPAISGDAWQWAASARSTGWTVVPIAQARSIVVWQRGVQGVSPAYGHVAWVDATQQRADGLYAHITEMNWNGPYRVDSRWVKDIGGMSYILAP